MKSLPPIRVPHPHVRVQDGVLQGSPYIAGSSIPVRRLWACHRGGWPIQKLMARYKSLGENAEAKVLDALAFAYDNPEIIAADLEREQTLFEQKALAPREEVKKGNE